MKSEQRVLAIKNASSFNPGDTRFRLDLMQKPLLIFSARLLIWPGGEAFTPVGFCFLVLVFV